MWSKIQDFYYRIACKPRSYRLYQRLKHYASLQKTTVCMLHEAEPGTPCPQSRVFCGTESRNPAINFDAVKEHYCAQNRISSMASVDLSYTAVNLLNFNDASMAELKTVGMNARYVYCRQFDKFYSELR